MDESTLSQEALSGKKPSFWKELFKLILLSVIIVIPFRIYIAQPFIVDGGSMEPTFKNGEYLIVDEITYRFKEPERGSVLIFKYPRDPKKFFIKRIIGLPGDTVILENGRVTIINNSNLEGFTLEEPYIEFPRYDNLVFQVGENEYFVMGDNRAASGDSRIWGGVPKENVIGRPIIRIIPLAIMPGNAIQVN